MPRLGRKRKEYRFNEGIEEKYCIKCDTWQPLKAYSKDKNKWDNLQSRCRICANVNCKKRYHELMKTEESRERLRAQNRKSHKKRRMNGKISAYENAYRKKRRKEDPAYRTKAYIRTRIWHCFNKNGVKKTAKTSELMGCTPEFLNAHLEKYFDDNMSWENRGEWHIDHVIPCCAFGATIEEQKILHWYGNLRPMWSTDNLIKNGTYKKEDKINLIKRYNKANNTNYLQ
tara:strand:- start:754 stop:1440 length:687 start_codon:yes stop_codon:yes gene_type:complete